jgi:hypothetical protein
MEYPDQRLRLMVEPISTISIRAPKRSSVAATKRCHASQASGDGIRLASSLG